MCSSHSDEQAGPKAAYQKVKGCYGIWSHYHVNPPIFLWFSAAEIACGIYGLLDTNLAYDAACFVGCGIVKIGLGFGRDVGNGRACALS